MQQEIQPILASQQCTQLIISKCTPMSGTKQAMSRTVQTSDQMPAPRKLPQQCSCSSTTTCPTELCTRHRRWDCQPGREMGTYPWAMTRHTGTVAPAPLQVCLTSAQIPHHYLQKKRNKSSFQSCLLYIVSNKYFGFPTSLYCYGVMSLA